MESNFIIITKKHELGHPGERPSTLPASSIESRPFSEELLSCRLGKLIVKLQFIGHSYRRK